MNNTENYESTEDYKNIENYSSTEGEKSVKEDKKKNNKKWLLILLLLLFLCLFGYGLFRIGFSVGEKHKPVSVKPTPQKMLIKITDSNGEWGGSSSSSNKTIKIEINPGSLSLEPNESFTIFGTTTSTKPIRWTSSDESCVTISPKEGEKPTVTAGDKECTAIIKAQVGDEKAEIVVTVVKKHDKLEGLKLNQSNYEVYIGKSVLASVVAVPTTAKLPDLIYKIEDTTIATVDENGVIRGVSEGKTKLIVTTVDGSYSSTATVTVKKENSGNDEEVNEINIFSVTTSSREYVAPYDSGVYEFDVKNTISKNITYDLDLEEENEDRVNIKYKLKKNGNYIIDHWVYYDEVNLKDVKLSAKQTDSFELEWCWVSENNELDTQIGLKKERAQYAVTIKVLAVQEVER